MKTFSDLYRLILNEDEEEQKFEEEDDDEAGNFFALKELMKLQYLLLTKGDASFQGMAMVWSNNEEYLKQVMNLALYEDTALKLETIYQL